MGLYPGGRVQGYSEVTGSRGKVQKGEDKQRFVDFSLPSANTAQPVPKRETPSCPKNRSKRK